MANHPNQVLLLFIDPQHTSRIIGKTTAQWEQEGKAAEPVALVSSRNALNAGTRYVHRAYGEHVALHVNA